MSHKIYGRQVGILYDKLKKRDGKTCHLCGLPIPFGRKTGPLRKTLDHIIPVSKGGNNDLENLRLAHQQCNYERGNRSVDDYVIEIMLRPRD